MEKNRIIAGAMTWGAWGRKWTTSEMSAHIEALHQLGIRSYDHADIYGGYTTEGDWGRAWAETGIDRGEVEIVSKCGIMMPAPARPAIEHKHYDHSYDHIVGSARRSVDLLRCAYLDTLLIHRPGPLMHSEEVARAVEDLKAEGVIRSFGVSNFLPHQVDHLRRHVPVESNQIEMSVAHLSPLTDGQIDHAMLHDIELMIWSPLGGGRLWSDEALRDRLQVVATAYDCTIEQLAYILLLHHPAQMRLVVGTTRIKRIKEVLSTLAMDVDDKLWYQIYTACLGHEVA
jgi:predicted oxidoreductase